MGPEMADWRLPGGIEGRGRGSIQKGQLALAPTGHSLLNARSTQGLTDEAEG
jgi:hypothetical protein